MKTNIGGHRRMVNFTIQSLELVTFVHGILAAHRGALFTYDSRC